MAVPVRCACSSFQSFLHELKMNSQNSVQGNSSNCNFDILIYFCLICSPRYHFLSFFLLYLIRLRDGKSIVWWFGNECVKGFTVFIDLQLF